MWTCPDCGRTFQRTGQSHYCGKAPASVDEYILKQDEALQPTLIRLRNAIRDAIPEAEETIAWGMPTWRKKGNIIHFAVSKKHLGVYVEQEAVSFFEARLRAYETSKGVIRLKYDQDMPLSLIADIARWSYGMDQAELSREN